LPSVNYAYNYTTNWWWKSPDKDLASILFGYYKWLDQNQLQYRKDFESYGRLYSDNDNILYGIAPRAYASTRVDRLRLNVVKSMCDTATAKIAKNKVKATFLTSGGDYTLQKKAKKLDKFVLGQFEKIDFYTLDPKIFLDSCIFGTGVLKLYREGNRIYADRTLPFEYV